MTRVTLILYFAVLLTGCSTNYHSNRVDSHATTNNGTPYHGDHQNSVQQEHQYNYIQRYSYRFPSRPLSRTPRTFRTSR